MNIFTLFFFLVRSFFTQVNVTLVSRVKIVQHQLNVLEWYQIQTVITRQSPVVSLCFVLLSNFFFWLTSCLISLLLPPTTSSPCSFFLFSQGGNGRCFRNRCYCAPGFLGDDCATPAPCEDGCSENGHCQDGAFQNFYLDYYFHNPCCILCCCCCFCEVTHVWRIYCILSLSLSLSFHHSLYIWQEYVFVMPVGVDKIVLVSYLASHQIVQDVVCACSVRAFFVLYEFCLQFPL